MPDQVSSVESLIGLELSHYRVIEEIGRGGMGVVYRARDTHLEREVAIKVLTSGTITDESARKHLRKEALALSQLNHPSIATVYDFDTQRGVDFLVMEYIPGITLSEKLPTGPLPEKEVLRLGIQLSDGLAAAHEHGVVHRDLKPGNLRLTSDGRLKILDFGLAKLRQPLAETAATESSLQTHSISGTLPYMAPEQLSGEEVDTRTDIHGAGFVLYEMATGQRPFAEVPSGQLIGALLRKPPIPPTTLNPKVSAELERIIGKCVEKDPENRYQSAKELAIDLRRLGGPSTTATPVQKRERRTLNLILVAGALSVAVCVALFALNVGGLRARLLGKAAPAPIRSLAVLPLENLSGDPGQEYFADGMTEELITNLGKLRALRVISRTSVMRYKKTNKPLPEIAKELNVDALIEGAVLRADNRVRITAQLIQGSSDRHLWAETYDGDLRDVLALQSEVARAITKEIKAEVTPQEQARLASHNAVNPEAYALYLQGKVLGGRDNDPDNRTAIEVLERAVTIDPNFAPAYAALGRTYADRLFGWEPKDEWKDKAEAAIGKALSLDPNLAEAHVSRAALLFTPVDGWQYERAIQECKQALALDPNLVEGHLTLGLVFFHVGLLDEARGEFQTAAAISPTLADPPLYIGFTLMFGGRCQDALPFLQSFPVAPFSKTLQALCLWELGRKEEAWKLDRELLQADPQEKFVYSAALHTLLLADSGQSREAQKRIKEKLLKQGEIMKPYGHFHHLANFVAMIYAQLNKPDQAVVWLEETAATGFPCYPSFEHDRAFDRIRQDAGFIAFMQKLKPQWEHFKSTYGQNASPGAD